MSYAFEKISIKTDIWLDEMVLKIFIIKVFIIVSQYA